MHRALWEGTVSGCEWTSQRTGVMIQAKEDTSSSGRNVERGRDENCLESKICRTERALGREGRGEDVKSWFQAGVTGNATDGGVHLFGAGDSTLWPVGPILPSSYF